jgi:predicted house-cleaning noncanonical NTP pyrophosphatase (MazG superfamily)
MDAGNIPHWRTLTEEDYIQELKKKMGEEAKEILSAQGDDLVKELADMEEIIESLLNVLKVSKEQLSEVQNKTNKKAGSFKHRQYIEEVEVKSDSEWIRYYLNNPEKYPEINT